MCRLATFSPRTHRAIVAPTPPDRLTPCSQPSYSVRSACCPLTIGADRPLLDIRTGQCSCDRFTAAPSDISVGWDDFVEALGGPVPSWRALNDAYPRALETAALNQLPEGTRGEAWLIFEDLLADGLEFVFGRRVHRMGGRRRTRRVGDIHALTPEERVLVVDAKAAENGFDARWHDLRPLAEYVRRQRARQRGHLEVAGAVIVSSRYRQDAGGLAEVSAQFHAEAQVPLSFMESAFLATVVQTFRERPDLRNAVRWPHILRAGGLVSLDMFERELGEARDERMARG
jgi:hypothetical protein